MAKLRICAIYQGRLLDSCTVEERDSMQICIGRSAQNNIVIDSKYVGREHCVLVFSQGLWYAKNQSQNGSFINGLPIDNFTPLYPSDSLSLLQGEMAVDIVFDRSETEMNSDTAFQFSGSYNTYVKRDDQPTPNQAAFSNSSVSQPAADLELLIIDSAGNAQKVHLDRTAEKQLCFGRAADNDIVISSPTVSGHHGVIELTGKHCYLYDSGSTNGLWVNGVFYHHNQRSKYELNPGDIVRINGQGLDMSQGALIVCTQFSGSWESCLLSESAPTVIGRSEDCDLRLRHVTVSRRHAVIDYDRSADCYYIENMGANGTLLDGSILTGRVPLMQQSAIQIANTSLYLCGDRLFYYVSEGGLRLEAVGITRDVDNHGSLKRILNNVNLTIEPGEFVAIVGGSGCGKSTLLNALTGYERSTDGTVLVGDKSLYHNYDYFKSLIGFVPQQDIVYDFLELDKMLDYTARLRMSKDAKPEERRERVRSVLEMVELTDFSSSMVKKLSGGQKKRASIAVELLADPGLFFLDEPTSGLDPGTERSLMYTLRNLSKENRKTVIMVTHTTLNLHLCDKVIFMGKGGRLCYCGRPDDALKFFGVNNFVDIYNLVADDTPGWHDRFEQMGQTMPSSQAESVAIGSIQKPSFFKQSSILSARYLNLIMNDKARLALMLLEPILMGLVLFVCKSDDMYSTYLNTKNFLFTYVCCAIWIGIFNSVQEICKERAILKREYMTNLRLSSYICSKFNVQALMCLVQSVLLFSVFAVLIGLPEAGILLDFAAPEMLLTTFLTVLSSTCMGLCLSAVTNSPDKAMTLSPFLLVVQLVFANIIFKLEGAVEQLSKITISRWSISALGISSDFERLYDKLQEQQALLPESARNTDSAISMFEHSDTELLKCWLIMLCFCLIFCVLSALLLRNVSKDSR